MLNNKNVIQFLLGYERKINVAEKQFSGKPLINPNLQDKGGRTAFFYAIRPCELGIWQNFETLNWLFDAKADPLIQDKNGMNAFDYAINDEITYWMLSSKLPAGKGKPNKHKPLTESSEV